MYTVRKIIKQIHRKQWQTSSDCQLIEGRMDHSHFGCSAKEKNLTPFCPEDGGTMFL
jgi:hypothetical protein